MIKLQDIMAAINAKLISKFDIEINDNDVQKGFNRPSFFVDFDNLYKTDHLYTFERGLTVTIYYFPTDRHKYQIEVLEMQQDIEDSFKLGFTVEDRYLSIVEGIESEVVDGVLQVSFELKYLDSSYEEAEGPKMEELIVNAGDWG